MVAIIPAAGRGTRMAEVTNGRPKELLRLGRKTVLDVVIDEAMAADADRIIVISSPDKPTLTERAEAIGVEVVLQPVMRGLAHAIACAGVEDDAIILLSDAVFMGTAPSPRMANLLSMGVDGCVAVEQVTPEEVSLYGIVDINEGLGSIRSIVEKPKREDALSNWAVASRYALSRPLMSALAQYVAEKEPITPGELGMTDFLMEMIAHGADFKAVAVQPGTTRLDCGDVAGYRRAIGQRWE